MRQKKGELQCEVIQTDEESSCDLNTLYDYLLVRLRFFLGYCLASRLVRRQKLFTIHSSKVYNIDAVPIPA